MAVAWDCAVTYLDVGTVCVGHARIIERKHTVNHVLKEGTKPEG
jgi:hypothetical protein